MKVLIPMILLSSSLALCFSVNATDDPSLYAGKSEMFGYKLKAYEGFEKNWHFVTVRFRKDTGEMRYVYANDLAWQSLKKGVTDYPDGSVFAKIGLATQEDPAFASSLVPSGARRYQLMVRKKSKHQDTDGWGYALFDSDGKTFPGEPVLAAKACAACHHLVPDRGFVFSQIAEISPFKKTALPISKLAVPLKYETVVTRTLPPEVKKYIPTQFESLRVLRGELEENIFQGTLDEIRPSLANESIKENLPALLLSKKHDRFSLVYRNLSGSPCPNKGDLPMTGVHSLDIKSDKVLSLEFCHKK